MGISGKWSGWILRRWDSSEGDPGEVPMGRKTEGITGPGFLASRGYFEIMEGACRRPDTDRGIPVPSMKVGEWVPLPRFTSGAAGVNGEVRKPVGPMLPTTPKVSTTV